MLSASATALIIPETPRRCIKRFRMLIVTVPVPYGSVLSGGTTLREALAFLAAGAAFLSRRPTRPLGLAWGPLLAIMGLVLLGCFQLLPLSLIHISEPTRLRRIS